MRILVESIKNIQPEAKSARRKDFRSVYAFLCAIANEYAVNVLKKNADDVLYKQILTYCSGNDISAKELFREIYTEDNEMVEFLHNFSFTEQEDEWYSLAKNIVWENDEKTNSFKIGEFSFSSPKTFLDVVKEGDDYYALELKIEEGVESFKAIRNINSTFESTQVSQSNFSVDIKNDIKSLEEYKDDSLYVKKDIFFTLTDDLKAADEDQRNAITADTNKNLLILAGAGSGKTRSLVGRMTYLHLVKGVPLHKMLLLTFTRAAASEMEHRGKDQISKAYITLNKEKSDNLYINASTIDAFFKRTITKWYLDIGFTSKPEFYFDDEADKNKRAKVLVDVIKKNKLEDVFRSYGKSWDKIMGSKRENGKRNSDGLLDIIDSYINGSIVSISGMDNLVNLYIEEQIRNNYVFGFACAAYILKKTLANSRSSLYKRICDNYDCILLDEFQDINSLQNDVLSNFYKSRIHFTFVGDDDQTIYTWRGADNSIIKDFADDEAVNTVFLTTNYRNNPYIVNAGNDILESLQNRAKGEHAIKAAKTTGQKVRLSSYDGKYSDLAHEVANVYNNREKGEKICILYREDKKKNSEREKIVTALGIEGVPVIAGDNIPEELSTAYKLFKSIILIQNKIDVKNQCSVIKEITATDLTTTAIKRLVIGKDAQPESEVIEADYTISQVWALAERVNLRFSHAKDFSEVVLNYNRVHAEIKEGQSDVDRNTQNQSLRYLQEYCDEFALQYPLSKKEFLHFFAGYEEKVSKRKPEKNNKDGIVVTTIHNAKGLEYDTVFIVGLNDGEYPNLARIIADYNRKIEELKGLEKSKEYLSALRAKTTQSTIDGLLSDCSTENWTGEFEKESQNYSDLAEEIEAYKDDYIGLSSDGIEAYIDAYCAYVKSSIESIELAVLQKNKEIEADLERADEREEVYSELEEDTEEYQLVYNEWNDLQKKIAVQKEQLEQLKNALTVYTQKVKNLTYFYDVCNEAKGYLLEIKQLRNQQLAIERLKKEKEAREYEERRIFYVAVSRAINRLYLCTEKGKTRSQFVSLIKPENCEEYVMHTYGQEMELKRMEKAISVVREEIKKQDEYPKSVDNKKIDEGIKEILDSTTDFKSEMSEYVQNYKNQNAYLGGLDGEAGVYIDRAISLMALTEKLGYNFDTEISHNLQRFAEVYIREKIGSRAVAVKTDGETASKMANDIRNIAGRLCRTQKPGVNYIEELLSTTRKFNDELMNCKNLAIECYVVFCGKYSIDASVLRTWSTNRLQIDAEKFLAEVIDLANIRNDAIHNGQDSWRTDYLPYIWGVVEDIVKAFAQDKVNYEKYVTQIQNGTALNDQDEKLVHQVKDIFEKYPDCASDFKILRGILNDCLKPAARANSLCIIGADYFNSIKNKTIKYDVAIKDVYLHCPYKIKEVCETFAVWDAVFHGIKKAKVEELKCPECGAKVALIADCCPNCGCPMSYIKK